MDSIAAERGESKGSLPKPGGARFHHLAMRLLVLLLPPPSGSAPYTARLVLRKLNASPLTTKLVIAALSLSPFLYRLP